ncbi:MAG: hypothetical protein GY778_05020, partial [bacterium]|nr:hypothetical protein [bacterium]
RMHYDGSDWVDYSPGTADYVNDVWGPGADAIYAVGSNGAIIRYDGTSWASVSHGLGNPYLRTIWGTASDDIWVAAEDGVMWHYDGVQWQSHSTWPPGYGYTKDLWGSASDDYYAVTNSGVLHYDGTEWNTVWMDGYSSMNVHGVSATEVYFLAGEGGIIAAPAADPDPIARPPILGASVLLRYNGSDFSIAASNLGARFFLMWALGSSSVFLAGEGSVPSQPVVGHFDGSRITLHEPAAHVWLNDIWGVDSSGFLCGGDGAMIRVTTNR